MQVVDAIELNRLECTYFACHKTIMSASNLEQQQQQEQVTATGIPTIAVVGGVHGNEIEGVKGAQQIIQIFKNCAFNPLAKFILSNANVLVVPCINHIGFSAQARSCPSIGTKVNIKTSINSATNELSYTVIVGDDEKGSSKMAPGWKDPNRGWDEENDTLVRFNLEQLITKYKVTNFIFNHDWAVRQGICKIYYGTVDETENMAKLVGANVKKIFTQYYPEKKVFGDAWEFIVKANEKEDGHVLPFKVWHKYGIPSLLLETYLYLPQSSEIHVKITMYLLYKLVLINNNAVPVEGAFCDEAQVLKDIMK